MRGYFLLSTTIICLLTIFTVVVHEPKANFYFDNISYNQLTKPTKKQIDCLADNIFFESAHEPEEGKLAVALVTLNRVNSGKYPNTICSVVYEKGFINNKMICQFSWVCDTKFTSRQLTIRNTELYNDIRKLSVYVYLNYEEMKDITNGALFYHADYVNPGWKLVKIKQIGRHIFYRS